MFLHRKSLFDSHLSMKNHLFSYISTSFSFLILTESVFRVKRACIWSTSWSPRITGSWKWETVSRGITFLVLVLFWWKDLYFLWHNCNQWQIGRDNWTCTLSVLYSVWVLIKKIVYRLFQGICITIFESRRKGLVFWKFDMLMGKKGVQNCAK